MSFEEIAKLDESFKNVFEKQFVDKSTERNSRINKGILLDDFRINFRPEANIEVWECTKVTQAESDSDDMFEREIESKEPSASNSEPKIEQDSESSYCTSGWKVRISNLLKTPQKNLANFALGSGFKIHSSLKETKKWSESGSKSPVRIWKNLIDVPQVLAKINE